jgi:hypothetical protein
MSDVDDAQGERDAALARLGRWLANQALMAGPVPMVAAGFADKLLAAPERFLSLGEQRLRGVHCPVEVFTLA